MRRTFLPVAEQKRLTQRRGAILVWFAVLLFAILPLIALVVHTGMVTVTRRQMQTAANAAALEGLRFRDDTNLMETERRAQVRDLVSAVYDDTLDAHDGDDALQFGAGPLITFDEEPTDISLSGTDFKAARTIRPENIGVYDPVLELNESNEPHGDMVRGTYSAGVGHTEENDYTRPDDFTPDANGDAFLVRLRRTDNASGLDGQPGVSSHGPPIPFLFGRGPYGGPDLLDRRERGTIVRATAVARTVPALTIGPEIPQLQIPGVGRFSLDLNSWMALPFEEAVDVLVLRNGRMQGVFRPHVESADLADPDEIRITLMERYVLPDPEGQLEMMYGVWLFPNAGVPSYRRLSDVESSGDPDRPVLVIDNPLGENPPSDVESVAVIGPRPRVLETSMDDSQTLMHVLSGLRVPDPNGIPAAMFAIQVDNEVMLVEDLDESGWHVQRNVFGTTTTHAANAPVWLLESGSPLKMTRLSQEAAASQVNNLTATIYVDSVMGLIDPNRHEAKQFDVRIDNELIRVLDFDDMNPTMWTVRPVFAQHDSGSIVSVPEMGTLCRVTQLSDSIPDATTTSLRVATGIYFGDPNNDPHAMYRVRIEEEVLRVLDVDNDDPALWIVERGVDGTTPASHLVNVGSQVEVFLVDPAFVGDPIRRTGRLPDEIMNFGGFAPIYQNVGQIPDRMIGFGNVNIARTPEADFGDGVGFTITKFNPSLAYQNVSAHALNSIARDIAETDRGSFIEALFPVHRNYADIWMLAPALTRSTK